MKLKPLITVFVIAAVAIALWFSLSDNGDLFKTTGIIMGKVNIGPLCPVEPCPMPVPDVYSKRQIVLTPQGGGRRPPGP